MAKRGVRKGAALVIVLAVLAVLSLLGTTFAVMQSVERKISQSYLDEVRAKALARSGVAAALDGLSADPFSKTLNYWGNDENENGKADNDETLDGASTVGEVPLDWAKNPSLAIERDGNPLIVGDVKKLSVRAPNGEVRQIGYSGAHDGSAHSGGMDIYQLKISDLSGRIYLNDGLGLYAGNESSVSQNLKRILNILGKLKTVRVPNLGDKILQFRPTNGYNTIEDLARVLSAEERKRVEPFVTTHAWIDKNVANPVPLSKAVLHEYPVKYWRGEAEGVYRQGRGKNAKGSTVSGAVRWFDEAETSKEHNAIYGLDELSPGYIEIVHRAPVNINVASREVLIALIAEVQGFFVSERRSFAPYAPSPEVAVQGGVTIPQKYYSWWTVQHSHDANGEDADAYGYLYRTMPLKAPEEGGAEMTTTAGGGATAATIADHIIACRLKKSLGSVDYTKEWYKGEFRTWAQFNRFLDTLVEKDIIKDTRNIFIDYVPSGSWTSLNATPSVAGRKFASQAIADALKANFNPNLHLNETNPDANLYLRVDKTDLIVNSTEFTFMPTGLFQIESLGRMLQQEAGSGTGTAAIHKIIAEKRTIAEVKVFDMYRETSQRHFYGGKSADKTGPAYTNSGYAIEVGPEPNNGPLVYGDHYLGFVSSTSSEADGYLGYKPSAQTQVTGWGYEADGYIQLSTIGGDGTNKQNGMRKTTSAGPSHRPEGGNWEGQNQDVHPVPETMHAHFQHDFDLHYCTSGFRKEYASDTGEENGEKVSNFPDISGFPPGPYGPTSGAQYTHRLARSYRLPPKATGSGTTSQSMPPMRMVPMGDLRMDGAYVERNSGLAYHMKQGVNFNLNGGAMAMWVKPSFYPEHTGKMRNVFNASCFHAKGPYRNPAPLSLMYLPAHDAPAYAPSAGCSAKAYRSNGAYNGTVSPDCKYLDPGPDSANQQTGDDAGNHVATERRTGGGLGTAKGVWQFPASCFMGFRAATSYDVGYGEPHSGYPHSHSYDVENYAVTSCLNHNLHDHGCDTGGMPNADVTPTTMRNNYFEAHRWTHVALSWRAEPPN